MDKKNADIFFEIERLWLMKREAAIAHSCRVETAYERLSRILQPQSRKYKLFGLHYWKYAAVGLIALLITVDIFYDRSVVPDAVNMVEVPKGQRVNLVLSDGTKVCLNSNQSFALSCCFLKQATSCGIGRRGFF